MRKKRRHRHLVAAACASGLAALGPAAAAADERPDPSAWNREILNGGVRALRAARPALSYSASSYAVAAAARLPATGVQRPTDDVFRVSKRLDLDAFTADYRDRRRRLETEIEGERLLLAGAEGLAGGMGGGVRTQVVTNVMFEQTNIVLEAYQKARREALHPDLSAGLRSWAAANGRDLAALKGQIDERAAREGIPRSQAALLTLEDGGFRDGDPTRVDPFAPEWVNGWADDEKIIYALENDRLLGQSIDTLIDEAVRLDDEIKTNRLRVEDLENKSRQNSEKISKLNKAHIDLAKRTKEGFDAVGLQINGLVNDINTLKNATQENSEDISWLQSYMYGSMSPAERNKALQEGNFFRGLSPDKRAELIEANKIEARRQEILGSVEKYLNGANDVLAIARDVGIPLPREVGEAANAATTLFQAYTMLPANALGAVALVSGLFGKGQPDPAAARHQQVVGMLEQVLGQLGDIQQDLDQLKEGQARILQAQQDTIELIVRLGEDIQKKHAELLERLDLIGGQVYIARYQLTRLTFAGITQCGEVIQALDADGVASPLDYGYDELRRRIAPPQDLFRQNVAGCVNGLGELIVSPSNPGGGPWLDLEVSGASDPEQVRAGLAVGDWKAKVYEPLRGLVEGEGRYGGHELTAEARLAALASPVPTLGDLDAKFAALASPLTTGQNQAREAEARADARLPARIRAMADGRAPYADPAVRPDSAGRAHAVQKLLTRVLHAERVVQVAELMARLHGLYEVGSLQGRDYRLLDLDELAVRSEPPRSLREELVNLIATLDVAIAQQNLLGGDIALDPLFRRFVATEAVWGDPTTFRRFVAGAPARRDPRGRCGVPAARSEASVAGGGATTAHNLMDRWVVGLDGQPLGRVSLVIADGATGRVQRLVITATNFLGLGEKDVEVDFGEVEARPGGVFAARSLTSRIVAEDLPQFKAGGLCEAYGALLGLLEEPMPGLGTRETLRRNLAHYALHRVRNGAAGRPVGYRLALDAPVAVQLRAMFGAKLPFERHPEDGWVLALPPLRAGGEAVRLRLPDPETYKDRSLITSSAVRALVEARGRIAGVIADLDLADPAYAYRGEIYDLLAETALRMPAREG